MIHETRVVMPQQLGVGVIGVGMLGRRHAENLAYRIPGVRLVAVADARVEVAKEVAGELGTPQWYATAEELCADPDVEAVVISSNDAVHAEGILAAARQKKEIFCEKPITTTLEDADAVIAAVRQAGVRLQIGFMRRYDPAYAAAKQQIDAGEIGTPVLFKAVHRNPSMPMTAEERAAAGPDSRVFVNSAIHDYDNARWLLGDEVDSVEAVAVRQRDPEDDEPIDLALSTLRFRRGGLGNVENVSACRYGYDVRTEIVGTRGTIWIGRQRETDCVVATAKDVHEPAVSHWLTRFGDTYRVELEDWVRRMRSGEPPAVTGADGRAALAIAIAATRAYEEGRTAPVAAVSGS